MLKLALDAGHGINTPGKRIPNSLIPSGRDPMHGREWWLNNRVCNHIEEMAKDYVGISILRLDDRSGRRDVPLRERTDKGNAWGADILLSQHHNAAGRIFDGGGIQVYAFNGSLRPNTLRYQKELYDKLIKHTGLRGNRSETTPRANFHMLRESRQSALLPENGFMDSRQDSQIMLTDEFARQVAAANMEFLAEEFNLEKKTKRYDTDKVQFVGEIIHPTLNVRDFPNLTTSKVKRRLSKGEKVVVYATSGHWYMIGMDEWISNASDAYVKKVTEKEYKGEVFGVRQRLNVRVGPSVEYERHNSPDSIPLGNTIDVYGEIDGWCYLGDGRFASGRHIRKYEPEKKVEDKEEDEALKNAILINSFADFPVAEMLSRRINAPIYLRGSEDHIKTERLYVVGGPRPKIDTEIVMLSGDNRFDTARQVQEYLSD